MAKDTNEEKKAADAAAQATVPTVECEYDCCLADLGGTPTRVRATSEEGAVEAFRKVASGVEKHVRIAVTKVSG